MDRRRMWPSHARGIRTGLSVAGIAACMAGCGSGTPGTGGPPPIGGSVVSVRLDGVSMQPTLANQEVIAVDDNAFATVLPRRGEIVTLRPPDDLQRTFIKRVIGLPGDVIEIDGSGATPRVLIVPGGHGPLQLLSEPYVPAGWTTVDFCCSPDGTASATAQPLTIPPGMYFVLGDNRDYSSDSREFGLVPFTDLIGRVLYKLSGGGATHVNALQPTLSAA